jgi:hypothetical protein
MNNKSTRSALLLTAGMVFSANSQAAEVSAEQFVSAMVSYTVSATTAEIQNSIQGAVLSAVNMFSLEEESAVAAHVTITDLESESNSEVSKKAE